MAHKARSGRFHSGAAAGFHTRLGVESTDDGPARVRDEQVHPATVLQLKFHAVNPVKYTGAIRPRTSFEPPVVALGSP
jgi:hypothetical protein